MFSGKKAETAGTARPANGKTPPRADDEIVARAMGFAQKYGTGLAPEVYHVWYTYAARENRMVNDTLDMAMNTDQPLSGAFMTALYHEHLSPRAMSEELNAIGTDLTDTMGSVGAAMDENLRQHSSFTGTLRSVKQSLAIGSSKQDVSEVVKRLHKANQDHLHAAQLLNIQLEKNRSQVSKLRSELIEAKKVSNTDYLTGLPNRKIMEEMLDQRIFESRQRKQPLTVLMGSIDNLQSITREAGLAAGDVVIRKFAQIAQESVRGDQMVARFAGVKFTLLLPNTDRTGGFRVAEHIRKKFRILDWTREGILAATSDVSVSFGGSVLRDGDSRSEVMDRSDRNLVSAQSEGLDRSFIS